MKQIRISGIVALANRVRSEACQPLTPDHKKMLKSRVASSLKQINRLLADARATADHLPTPSRKAYHYLSTLDLSDVPTASQPHIPQRVRTVSFPGIRSLMDRILDDLYHARTSPQLSGIADSIRKAHHNIEQQMRAGEYEAAELTTESRDTRGWLAYFAQTECFEQYVSAIRRAKTVVAAPVVDIGMYGTQVVIHLRPVHALFRVKTQRGMTRIVLPAPMVCFDDGQFQALTDLLLKRTTSKQSVVEALHGEPCLDLRQQLDILGGLVDLTAGRYHDLADSFERVNAAYFEDKIDKPTLAWTRNPTFRKFGHYDQLRDTVVVSATLDHEHVPAVVVDFIMYHELLHKVMGVAWSNGRRRVHPPAFQKRMRLFKNHDEAEKILQKLARKG